jgi:thiol-disulfide isomerase/thioredoxin
MKQVLMVLAMGFGVAGCGGQAPVPSGGGEAAAPSDEGAGAAAEIQAAYWLNSEPLTLAALRGKVVVLEFWATWCPPCRTSIPHLIKLNREYKDKGVVFVSLTDEPRATVEPFAAQMKMDYAIGGGSPTAGAYGVQGIPTAFIIDPAGRVAWEGHPMGGLDAALKAAVEKVEAK